MIRNAQRFPTCCVSHRRGSWTPPKPSGTGTCLTALHDLQMAEIMVALSRGRPAATTMPRTDTSCEDQWAGSALMKELGLTQTCETCSAVSLAMSVKRE